MRILDPSSLPRCQMDRVICHWSEGNHRANDTDLRAYHILIEGDGKIRFGVFRIDDNISTTDGRYAAHTLNCNTRSIGVSCCSMVGCEESPFQPGSQPMNQTQWQVMSQVVADLCEFYRIPVTPTTVLGHGEVQDNLGITQRGKWDPLVLPWDSSTFDVSKTRHVVGNLLRAQVTAQLGGNPAAIRAQRVAAKPPAVVALATPSLRSLLFAGNADLEAVAAGHRVLRMSAQSYPGVGLLQDALNKLADTTGGDYRIDLGPARTFRSSFGQNTERAVLAFQHDHRLREDGMVGQSTIRALDDELVRAEKAAASVSVAPPTIAAPGLAIPVAGTVTPSGYAPPQSSATLFRGVDFSTVDEERGRTLMEAFAAADRGKARGDPSNCKALLCFPDGTVYYDAKMAICADGSPRALEIDFPDGQTQTAFTFPPNGAGAFFNAEEVPYIVLPGRSRDGSVDFVGTFGIGSYDLAVVIRRGKITPAFYGEVGPTFRLGEASIKVHENLPVPFPWTSPRKDRILNSSVESDVLYCVFPGSAITRTNKMTDADWLDETLQAAIVRFEQFAGGS